MIRNCLYSVIIYLGLSPEALGQMKAIRNLNIEDGLPHSSVTMLVEDQLGYVWIGTFGGGVVRYDGVQLKTFDESQGLLSSVTLGLSVDSRNNIWICTPLGISKIQNDTLINIKGSFERGYFGVYAIEHRDSIFTVLNAGRDWRFGVIVNNEIVGVNVTLGMKQRIVNAYAPNQDQLYIALETGEIVLKDSTTRIIGRGLNVTGFLKSNTGVHAITQDGIFDLTPNGCRLRWRLPQVESMAINSHFTKGWAQINGKWFDLDFSSTEITQRRVDFSFKPVYPMIDSEGNNWFATMGEGVYITRDVEFERIGIESSPTYAFTHDENQNIWIGTRDGLLVVSSQNILLKKIVFADPKRSRITALTRDKKHNIWVGTLNGLAVISPKTNELRWLSKTDGLSHHSIRALEQDHLGRMWIAYLDDKGLDRWDDGKVTHLSLKHGLLSPDIWDLKFSPANNIMYICTGMGIQRFDGLRFHSIEIPEFKDKILLSLGLYNSKYLLVGSGGAGLALVNLETGTHKIFTKQQGLSSNFISLADADSSNTIWVGTVSGIDQIVLDNHLNLKSIVHHDKKSGLNSNGVNTNAIYFNHKQKYFGTTQGGFRYSPNLNPRKVNFPLHFLRVLVNNRVLRIPYDSVFDAHENYFTFIFNKVDKSGLKVRYQYQLNPGDSEWINSTLDNRVAFSNLNPGRYEMRVRASNHEGSWIEPISYFFTIQPPIYKRLEVQISALIIGLALVAGIIYLQFQSRISRLVRAEKERNAEAIRLRKEIGRDFHDEVGNQLARIINYVGLLKLNKSNRTELLDKAEETTKHLLTGTKDFLWSIDPQNDNVDSLQVQIRDFADQVLAERGIEFRLYTNVTQPVKLPFGYTRQVNLIFKEAVTNVFKHSGATETSLHFEYQNNEVKIWLNDNGVGIPLEKTNLWGQGIENMKIRANRINARLVFNHLHQSGTQVKLVFKLS